MKKTLLVTLLCSSILFAQKKEELSIFENTKKWKQEIIKFPINWAPDVKLKGFEELLFTPNWKNNKSDDFWTLIMGWKVNAATPLSLKQIEQNFKGYFDGLMKPNHWATEFPKPKVSFKMKNGGGFTGNMIFFDGFHTGKITTVHIQGKQYFQPIQQKTIVSFKISPKNFNHSIWKTLNAIQLKKEKSKNLIQLDSTWGKEEFRFPARNMNYQGIGEVRFPPKGWRNPNHKNFWSYTYAWKINANKTITADKLALNLVQYFNSLNHIKMSNSEDKRYTLASITKIKSNNSTLYFKGKTTIFDRFATQKMITLNVLIESNFCKKTKKTVILFKFSPKKFQHKTWKMLDTIKLTNNLCY